MLIIEPPMLARLAESYLGVGDVEHARVRAEETSTLAQHREMLTQEIEAQLGAARVHRHAEALTSPLAIEAGLGRAVALFTETTERGFELHVHVERAEFARLKGDEAARKRELREAHRLFTEIGATVRATEIAKELGL
jgi:hypothetical protein